MQWDATGVPGVFVHTAAAARKATTTLFSRRTGYRITCDLTSRRRAPAVRCVVCKCTTDGIVSGMRATLRTRGRRETARGRPIASLSPTFVITHPGQCVHNVLTYVMLSPVGSAPSVEQIKKKKK